MKKLFPLPALATIAFLAGIGTASPQTVAVDSLREGNRLYREGRLEEARDAYAAGYLPEDPHPVLTYNLATTSHQLGQLPEAILWYRRAAAVNPGDPWLHENLAGARGELGLQPYPRPGLAGSISQHAQLLYYSAALLAWLGVGWWIWRPRSVSGPATLMVLGVLLYAITWAGRETAPRAAVVIEQCSAPAGDLPAGSEVWIRQLVGERVQLTAGEAELDCPRSSIALVSGVG